MALTATEDLPIGMKVRVDEQGYWATREIFIEGFDPSSPPGLLFGATIGGVEIPDWAHPHPFLIGTNCLNSEMFPFPLGSRVSVKIRAEYGPVELVDGWKITISGSNGIKTLAADSDGNPIVVRYTPPSPPGIETVDSDGNPISIAPPTPVQQIDYVSLPYLAPGTIVVFEHKEYLSPWAKIQAFKCCTNSVSFLGFPAHKVLCRDIQAESLYSGLHWHVRYIFECDPSYLGFEQLVPFRDQYTNQIPSDISGTDGTHGLLKIDPYEKQGLTADFNTLSLPTSLLL